MINAIVKATKKRPPVMAALLTLLFLPVLAFLGACSGENTSMASVLSRSSIPRGFDDAVNTDSQGPQSDISLIARTLTDEGARKDGEKSRKLIRRATLRLRAEDLEGAEKLLMEALDIYGAYVVSSNIYENSRSYTLRVPADSYRALLEDFSGLGRLIYRSEHSEDVSLRYYDLDGRLKTKRELLATFQNYLGRARNIEEIMTVETRIAELQNEIDRMGTELTGLSNQTDYATIDLELLAPSSSSRSTPGLGERLADLFRSFGDYISVVLVVLAGIIIYGIPGLLILALLVLILFGRIGLIRKLFSLAAGRGKTKPEDRSGGSDE